MLVSTTVDEHLERGREGGPTSGVRLRPMDDVDLGRVRELRSVVRWAADPRAFDLLRGMRDARWALAEAPDGSLAGMVGAVPLGEVGVLCHLAVRDEFRGLGLGRRLSSWAVAYLRSRGASLVRLYSTRRAEGMYASLGFEPRAARVVYRRDGTLRLSRSSREADGHRVETLRLGDLPELYGADRWSYGADRSALISAILRLHPGGGLVARDRSGAIKGYLVRSSSGRATRIGPFVASTDGVARLLLSHALREGTADERPVEVAVPAPERGRTGAAAHGLLRGFGFVGREDRLRMELGEAPHSGGGLEQYGTTPYLAT